MGEIGDRLDFGDEIDWEPRRLVLPGPWAGHIPFAFWLIKASAPQLLVELGTHSGNSFSAFCQAIAALKTPSQAFAVDTWHGDEHAGYYGEEVFVDLSTFVEQNYGEFSTLVRSTFDEAIAHFTPKTVDILHIDGLHGYEAVRHDYLTWVDMLSDRGVVVFHDTAVMERGFGVTKLWNELAEHHPSFEFTHCNGLGVLGVGANLPPVLSAFFEAGRDERTAQSIRALFALRGKVHELGTEILALRGDNGRAQTHNAALEERNGQLQAESERCNRVIVARDQAIAAKEREIEAAQYQRAELARTVDALYRSTSWRVTKPLRQMSRMFNRSAAGQ